MSEQFGAGPVSVHIEYCGGWGYRKYAVEAMQNMNAEFGEEHFSYEFARNPKISGRLEVTVNDKLVHSKAASGKYIHENWTAYMDAEKAAMQWTHQMRWYEIDFLARPLFVD